MTREPAELTAAIDAVAWVKLHHAYGPATDVPGQLRGLLSTDPDIRGQAFWALYSNVYHQGSRWEVSAHVVPLLVRIASHPATPDRPAVTGLLRSVGIGDFNDQALPFDPDAAFGHADNDTLQQIADMLPAFYGDDLDGDDAFELMDIAARVWDGAAFRAIAEHTDIFRRWLSDRDAGVAARAAELLAWFPPVPETITALVSIRADTIREAARASANLTLGHSTSRDGRINSCLQRQLAADSAAVRLSAAVALAYRQGPALPSLARSELSNSAEASPAVSEFVGWERAPQGFAALARRRIRQPS